jgi:hypothetical protein
MQNSQRFSIFDNNIINDIFGEEVVLVNLESGVYYSLRSSATQIWKRIINQYSIEEILIDLLEIYQTDEKELIEEIHQFIQSLLEKKIIKAADFGNKMNVEISTVNEKVAFLSPVIETFSDMQEILLLDPVHDVDKAGWPISNTTNASEASKS